MRSSFALFLFFIIYFEATNALYLGETTSSTDTTLDDDESSDGTSSLECSELYQVCTNVTFTCCPGLVCLKSREIIERIKTLPSGSFNLRTFTKLESDMKTWKESIARKKRESVEENEENDLSEEIATQFPFEDTTQTDLIDEEIGGCYASNNGE